MPRIADWCAVHLVRGGRHDLVARDRACRSGEGRSSPGSCRSGTRRDRDNSRGAAEVIRSGSSQLIAGHPGRRVRGGGAATRCTSSCCASSASARSSACRCSARGRMLGAITLVTAESGRRYTRPTCARPRSSRCARRGRDRERAALRRGRAPRAGGARARDDRRRRRAARQRGARPALEQRRRGDHRHRAPPTSSAARPREALPGYADNVAAVDVDGRPQTVPVEIDGSELWLSFSAVRFDEGTVYAFRDLTEERGLEQMRSDFVATVSHELRTPLAAIYGAAVTLRRAISTSATRCAAACSRSSPRSPTGSPRSSTTCCSRATSTPASCS